MIAMLKNLLLLGPSIGLDGTMKAGGLGLHTARGRSAAKDRSGRLFCFARNGRMAARGK
jgi:hypothetical protein